MLVIINFSIPFPLEAMGSLIDILTYVAPPVLLLLLGVAVRRAGGFRTEIVAHIPTRDAYEEGFEYPEFAELFERASSSLGREMTEVTTAAARRGIQAWTSDIVDILVGTGTCNFHQQDLMGRTALHHAAMFGHLPAVKTLLGAGAPMPHVPQSETP